MVADWQSPRGGNSRSASRHPAPGFDDPLRLSTPPLDEKLRTSASHSCRDRMDEQRRGPIRSNGRLGFPRPDRHDRHYESPHGMGPHARRVRVRQQRIETMLLDLEHTTVPSAPLPISRRMTAWAGGTTCVGMTIMAMIWRYIALRGG